MKKKLKTNRGTAKRFKFTKNNKAVHQKCGKSHLLTNKNGSHKRSPYGRVAPEGVASKIKVLLPHKLR